MRSEPKPRQERPVEHALRLRADGELGRAIEVLYAALADDLTHLPTLSTLASMLAEDEQFERADRLFRRALEVGPPAPMLLHNYGTFLAHSGHPVAGMAVLGDAMAGQVRVLRRLLRDHDVAAAADALEHLGPIECNFARTLLVTGQAEAALACARKWLTSRTAWESATDVALSAIETLGRDVPAEMAALHHAQQASPAMVAELGDAAASASGDDADAFHIFLQGSAYLFDDWHAGFDTPLFLSFRRLLAADAG